jgi:hypothetical protein
MEERFFLKIEKHLTYIKFRLYYIKNPSKEDNTMITKRYAAMMSIKAPEYIEEFYKKNAKNKLKELFLDIPSEIISLVLKLKKPYKTSLMSVSMQDKEIIDQISKEYGIAKGDALLAILMHNFPEVKDALIKLTKEETNNGKEKTKK